MLIALLVSMYLFSQSHHKCIHQPHNKTHRERESCYLLKGRLCKLPLQPRALLARVIPIRCLLVSLSQSLSWTVSIIVSLQSIVFCLFIHFNSDFNSSLIASWDSLLKRPRVICHIPWQLHWLWWKSMRRISKHISKSIKIYSEYPSRILYPFDIPSASLF